jgi:hypothetical protein
MARLILPRQDRCCERAHGEVSTTRPAGGSRRQEQDAKPVVVADLTYAKTLVGLVYFVFIVASAAS